MSSLRRTRVGPFREGISLEEVRQAAEQERAAQLLTPVDSCFAHFPAVTATEREEKKFIRNGCQYNCNLENGKYRVYSSGGEFLMLGQAEQGRMTTIKSFFEV